VSPSNNEITTQLEIRLDNKLFKVA